MPTRVKHRVRSVSEEFDGAELGDARRVSRLKKTAAKLAVEPGLGFPRALVDEADLEGFYRLMRNDAVTFEALLAPHVRASLGRMNGRKEVLALHDTTEFRFNGEREGLGLLKKSGHGFQGHFTLAVSADRSRAPLGAMPIS
jgi:hypothetical protein